MERTAFLSVAELGARFRAGSATPVAAVRELLARIALLDGRLNAFPSIMAEAALAQAEKRGAELASGRDRGPMHGIPVAIKDLVEVGGTPTWSAP